MSFDRAFQHTVGVEGGYSNNPADPGGETMFGITARVARAHGYQGAMKDMPILAAKDIYRQSYWLAMRLDLIDPISPAIAEEAFDTGVNMGVGVPIPWLQEWLNALNRQGKDYPDQPVDGHFGAVGADALRKFLAKRGKEGEKRLLAALNAEQAVRYREIVQNRPTSEDFLFGWLGRIAA